MKQRREHLAILSLAISAVKAFVVPALLTFLLLAGLVLRPMSAEAVTPQLAQTKAVISDGSLWSWGYLSETSAQSNVPHQVGAGYDWAKLSAPYMSGSVAIKEDGSLWTMVSWPDTYTRVGTETDWADAVAGGEHYVALKANGTLWTWGNNMTGALGDGTTTSRNSPGQVGADADWVAISAGYRHTLAIKADGTLWSWGHNWKGQLGYYTASTDVLSPRQVGTDTDWSKVFGYIHSTMAIKTDSTLWAWGSNYSGNLCDGTTNSWGVSVPTKIGSETGWVKVSGGLEHSLVLKADGSLWMCGGFNYDVDGDGAADSSLAPVRLGTDNDWNDIAAGASHSVAAKTDGTVWAWGDNTMGWLGDGSALVHPEPVQIDDSIDWSSIDLGENNTLAVKTDGSLWGWGENNGGTLGNGSTVNSSTPSQAGTDQDWKIVAAGFYHSAGIRLNGTLWAWGSTHYDSNADGLSDNTSQPIQVGTDSDWESVAAGPNITYAIKTDGTMWTWGYTLYDRDADGNPDYALLPIQVETGSTWAAVAVYGHVLAIKTDGTLWSWGTNSYGQLGTESCGPGIACVSRYTPAQVGYDTDWDTVAVGHMQSLAIKNNGTLWTWGSNEYGQLGRYTQWDQNPTLGQVGADVDWAFVAAGERHSLAIKTDGSLWSWGYCGFGQCGIPSQAGYWSFQPTRVGTDSDWVSVDGGYRHSGGVKTDGSAWTWGYTKLGQLGIGIFGYSYSLVQVQFPVTTFTITPSAGANGSISPSVPVTVDYGGSQCFDIIPGTGYRIADVLVDGGSVGAITSYCFSNVTTNHTISAGFTIQTFTITPSAGANGSISPSVPVTVDYGGSQCFTSTPNTNYRIADVVVDGISQGAISSYCFTNVTANHSINASFAVYSAVTVLTPNGGEIIASGSTYTIRWGAPSNAVRFDIAYSTNNGSSYTSIASNQTGYSYTWSVPRPRANSTTCRIRVIGRTSSGSQVGSDASNSAFTIEVIRVTAPNGGEVFSRSSTPSIPVAWITNGTAQTVNRVILSYSTNGGSSWNSITTLSTNPGTYTWTLPNTNSSQYLVRVEIRRNSSVLGNDISNANFTVGP